MNNPLLAVVAEAVVELRNDMISVLHELQSIDKRMKALMRELEEAKDEPTQVDTDEVPGWRLRLGDDQ